MWVVDAVCQLENNFVPAVDPENNRRRFLLPEVNWEGNKAIGFKLFEKRISNFPLSLSYCRQWERQQEIFHSDRLFNQIFLQTGWQIGITRFHPVKAPFFCALPFKSPSTRLGFVHLGPSFDWVIYSRKIGLKLRRMGKALDIESSSSACLLSEMSFRNFFTQKPQGLMEKMENS